MELYQVKAYAKLLLDEISDEDEYYLSSQSKNKIYNFCNIVLKVLPNHITFITNETISMGSSTYSRYEAIRVIKHIQDIIEIEQMIPPDLKQSLFETSFDKYKKCKLFYEENDFTSLFNNLNSSLELLLKESLDLPTTSKIPTSNIIDKLAKHKIDPYIFLDVCRKKIIDIDNKVKHSGYNPSKKEAIDAMKSMEDTLNKLHGKKIIISQDVRDELYEML